MSIEIRPYTSDDYEKVISIFGSVHMEYWTRTIFDLVIGKDLLSLLLHIAINAFVLYFVEEFQTGMVICLFYNGFIVLFIYFLHRCIVLYANMTDLRDKPLSYWTKPQKVSGFFVATVQKRIVGFISYEEVSQEELELGRCCVDPDFRRLGIANDMVKHVQKVCTELGYKSICLHASNTQTGSIKLYEKLGFETFQVKPYHYWMVSLLSGRKLVLMKWTIDKPEEDMILDLPQLQ